MEKEKAERGERGGPGGIVWWSGSGTSDVTHAVKDPLTQLVECEIPNLKVIRSSRVGVSLLVRQPVRWLHHIFCILEAGQDSAYLTCLAVWDPLPSS